MERPKPLLPLGCLKMPFTKCLFYHAFLNQADEDMLIQYMEARTELSAMRAKIRRKKKDVRRLEARVPTKADKVSKLMKRVMAIKLRARMRGWRAMKTASSTKPVKKDKTVLKKKPAMAITLDKRQRKVVNDVLAQVKALFKGQGKTMTSKRIQDKCYALAEKAGIKALT